MYCKRVLFEREFQSYTNGTYSFYEGEVRDAVMGKPSRLRADAPEVFHELWRNLRPGMTMADCYKLFVGIVGRSELKVWFDADTWVPKDNEWWYGAAKVPMRLHEGAVVQCEVGDKRNLVSTTYRRALSHVGVGATLSEIRSCIHYYHKYAKAAVRVRTFDPNGEGRSKALLETYKQSANNIPELLSRGGATCCEAVNGDYIVTLYGVTSVWANDKRTEVSPLLRKTLKEYVNYARRRLPSDVASEVLCKRLTVQYDCTLDVVFGRKVEK